MSDSAGDPPPNTFNYYQPDWGTWRPFHGHQHQTHEHLLNYCAQCDATYCRVCFRQWGGMSVTWINTASSNSIPQATTRHTH